MVVHRKYRIALATTLLNVLQLFGDVPLVKQRFVVASIKGFLEELTVLFLRQRRLLLLIVLIYHQLLFVQGEIMVVVLALLIYAGHIFVFFGSFLVCHQEVSGTGVLVRY
jgi:hypothetical protein